jgi:ribose 5-phosphate isomerase B
VQKFVSFGRALPLNSLKIAIGCDHGGFRLKQEINKLLDEKGCQYKDFGTFSEEAVDYPDIALKVAEVVRDGIYDRGILVCGTGIGIGIAANKIAGIRAALCHDSFSARASREHNNANILTLGERVIGPGLAKEIVDIWLNTDFAGGLHAARIQKITELEKAKK